MVRDAAGGHVVTTILIAMVAMLFTAVSYGRMARVYPSAGSAYTYVGKEIHPLAGYVVGWSILMDYILNPLHCAIWARCSGTKHFAADSLCGIGFDGSSTMSEEVENPRRNILLATALTCFAIGVLSAVEVYLAQLAWPARAPFPASMVGYSLCTGGASRGRQLPFPIIQCDPADCEYGLWDRGSVRSGTSALWHGTRRCASETILWCRESQTRIPRNSVPLLRAVALAFHLNLAGWPRYSCGPIDAVTFSTYPEEGESACVHRALNRDSSTGRFQTSGPKTVSNVSTTRQRFMHSSLTQLNEIYRKSFDLSSVNRKQPLRANLAPHGDSGRSLRV